MDEARKRKKERESPDRNGIARRVASRDLKIKKLIFCPISCTRLERKLDAEELGWKVEGRPNKSKQAKSILWSQNWIKATAKQQ